MDAVFFAVIRRCEDSHLVCEPGCNCDRVTVDVGVDELRAAEFMHFAEHGTEAQRTEIADYMGADTAREAA